jgi:hypothetical protein
MRRQEGKMGEADTKLVQLVLTLFRNLLFLPDRGFSLASAGDHLTHLQARTPLHFSGEVSFEENEYQKSIKRFHSQPTGLRH